MPALVLSSWSLPAARGLAEAARSAGWATHCLEDAAPLPPPGDVACYVDTEAALAAAARLNVALLEPPLDLLARLPLEFRRRNVEFARFGDLHRLHAAAFVKPADALHKVFDAGIYANGRDIRTHRPVDPQTPVLLAEPVEWLAEFRCFLLDGQVMAWSPYLSFGRPVWKPFAEAKAAPQIPPVAAAVAERLARSVALPPALVVDVGLIEDRGWAVVEFNPAWCSGLLGADPARVLPVLARACRDAARLSDADRRWARSVASDQSARQRRSSLSGDAPSEAEP
jgi:hypothetical protein